MSVVVLGLAACSDDGGDDVDAGGDPESVELTDAEQEFADAFSVALQDDENGFGVPESDADCMGAAIMAELGTGPFEDAEVTAADIGDADDENSPGEILGAGAISDDQANAILTTWDEDCVELADVLADSAGADFELDADGVTCFADGLREGDLARNVLLPSFTQGSDDLDGESLGQITALLESCGALSGDGGIIESIANELSADGAMTEEDAQCIAQAVVDDLGLERLTELTAGGSFDEADPAAQQEITGSLLAAAGVCDVPVSAFGG